MSSLSDALLVEALTFLGFSFLNDNTYSDNGMMDVPVFHEFVVDFFGKFKETENQRGLSNALFVNLPKRRKKSTKRTATTRVHPTTCHGRCHQILILILCWTNLGKRLSASATPSAHLHWRTSTISPIQRRKVFMVHNPLFQSHDEMEANNYDQEERIPDPWQGIWTGTTTQEEEEEEDKEFAIENSSGEEEDYEEESDEHDHPFSQPPHDDTHRDGLYEGMFDFNKDDQSRIVHDDATHIFSSQESPTPLAYRFYRRALYRRHRATFSLPFVLLGPNVDHWKATGQELAAAGFSAIVCERVHSEEEENESLRPTQNKKFPQNSITDMEASAQIIVDLLDALRWNRVVLVACDSECILAMQAAMLLAPERIVGLVLCGNLDAAQNFVAQELENQNPVSSIGPRHKSLWGSFAVDDFVSRNVDCPTTIVWDGDGDFLAQQQHEIALSMSTPSYHEAIQYINSLAHRRTEILGSGSAPHRKVPQLLSWHLTRFVEQRVAPWPQHNNYQKMAHQSNPIQAQTSSQDIVEKEDTTLSLSPHGTSRNLFLDEICQFFSQDGMVVFGRVMASALLYGTILRVGFFQYRNFRDGIFDFHTKLTLLSSLPAQLLALIRGVFGSSSLSSTSKSSESLSDDTQESGEKRAAFPDEDEQSIDNNLNSSVPQTNATSEVEALAEEEAEVEERKEEAEEGGNSQEGDDDEEEIVEMEEQQELDEDEKSPGMLRPDFFLDYVIA